MGCGEDKENASNQKAGDADLWIKIWEELQDLQTGYFDGIGKCKGAPHEERKEKYVAF